LRGNVAEAIHARGLSLPSSSHLTAEQQRRVSTEVASALTVKH